MATGIYYSDWKFIALRVKLFSNKKDYKRLIRWDAYANLKLQSTNDCTKISRLRADGDYSIRQNHCEIQNSSKARKKKIKPKKAYLHLTLFHRQPSCEMWCFCQAVSSVLLHSTWWKSRTCFISFLLVFTTHILERRRVEYIWKWNAEGIQWKFWVSFRTQVTFLSDTPGFLKLFNLYRGSRKGLIKLCYT